MDRALKKRHNSSTQANSRAHRTDGRKSNTDHINSHEEVPVGGGNGGVRLRRRGD